MARAECRFVRSSTPLDGGRHACGSVSGLEVQCFVVPSQNGFVAELPQRQRKIVVWSEMSYAVPAASMTVTGPSTW